MEGCSTGFDWLREVSVKLSIPYHWQVVSGGCLLLSPSEIGRKELYGAALKPSVQLLWSVGCCGHL